MVRLPPELEVLSQPGNTMGITENLSRSPHFEVPEELANESELTVASFPDFNTRKNETVLDGFPAKMEADLAYWNQGKVKQIKESNIAI